MAKDVTKAPAKRAKSSTAATPQAATKTRAKVAATPSKPKAAAKPKAAPAQPKPAARAVAAPEAAKTPSFAGAAELRDLTSAQREAMETLSANLARAALTAQGAIADAALRSADRPAALSPDPFHVAPALNAVMGRLAAQPDRMMRAQADLFGRYLDLWRNTTRRMAGQDAEPVVEPAKGDKRFNDADWSANPVFDVMKQSYLLTSNWLNDLVTEVDGVDALSKRRVEFFMKMLTDAFSPSNFLMSNPAALREMATTQGESLVRGMENFAGDLARGGGQLSISQTDFAPFQVGENIATAPGKVIFQNELIQVLQFTPTTDKAHEIPLLIFPPWINKY